ncbi:MAG: hypothetical protein VW270_25145 [Candidatus Poseidoniales archaeon]
MSNTEYEEYRIEIHKGNSGRGWWCQERIQLPVKGNGWDEEELHSMLEHELLEKMVAVITGWLGPESDWEDVYGGEEE